MLALLQKAQPVAAEIKKDPFAIKRSLPATPEMLSAAVQPFELKREQLAAKMAVGTGQVCCVLLSSYVR